MNLLLAAVLLLQDKTAEETFKKIEEQIEKAKTLTVKFKIVVAEGDKIQLTGSGTLLLKEGNKLNYTIKSLEEEIHDKEFRFVSDGLKIRGSYHRERRGTLGSLEQATPGDLRDNFNAAICRAGVAGLLAEDASNAFLGELKPNPKTTPLEWKKTLKVSVFKLGESEKQSMSLAFRLKYGEEDNSRGVEMKLWFDSKGYQPLKRVLKIAGSTVTETYEEFTLNADIPDEKFVIPEEKK